MWFCADWLDCRFRIDTDKVIHRLKYLMLENKQGNDNKNKTFTQTLETIF